MAAPDFRTTYLTYLTIVELDTPDSRSISNILPHGDAHSAGFGGYR